MCPSRLHRSWLFEPDSSGVFARHYYDGTRRRNVTNGRTCHIGQVSLVIFTITRGKIVEINVVADPARLRQLDPAILND
ncbi:MAG: hypothetical protein ACYDER_14275 [Ktedonobacteraceae bacterium]